MRPFCRPSPPNPRIACTAEASAAWQKPQEDRTGRLQIDHEFFKESSGVKIDLGRSRVHGTPSSGQTCVGDNLKAKLGSLGRSRYCPRHLGSGFPPRKAIPNKRVHLMLGQFVEKEQALLNDVRNMKSEKVSSSQ